MGPPQSRPRLAPLTKKPFGPPTEKERQPDMTPFSKPVADIMAALLSDPTPDAQQVAAACQTISWKETFLPEALYLLNVALLTGHPQKAQIICDWALNGAADFHLAQTPQSPRTTSLIPAAFIGDGVFWSGPRSKAAATLLCLRFMLAPDTSSSINASSVQSATTPRAPIDAPYLLLETIAQTLRRTQNIKPRTPYLGMTLATHLDTRDPSQDPTTFALENSALCLFESLPSLHATIGDRFDAAFPTRRMNTHIPTDVLSQVCAYWVLFAQRKFSLDATFAMLDAVSHIPRLEEHPRWSSADQVVWHNGAHDRLMFLHLLLRHPDQQMAAFVQLGGVVLKEHKKSSHELLTLFEQHANQGPSAQSVKDMILRHVTAIHAPGFNPIAHSGNNHHDGLEVERAIRERFKGLFKKDRPKKAFRNRDTPEVVARKQAERALKKAKTQLAH